MTRDDFFCGLFDVVVAAHDRALEIKFKKEISSQNEFITVKIKDTLSWQHLNPADMMLHMQVPTELKKRYLVRRIQEIKNLKDALYVGDYSHALKLGHQVKGNAATFDFHEMGPIGKEMELAASEKNKERVEYLALEMESILYRAGMKLICM